MLCYEFHYYCLPKFRINLLAVNHSIIWGTTKFDNDQKSLKFLLEIMTLVSSVNNTGSDTEFILMQRSLENSMFQCTPVGEKNF
jgi:hypothetical protein